MLNARLAGMEGAHGASEAARARTPLQKHMQDTKTMTSVLNAMNNAVAAANGMGTPKIESAARNGSAVVASNQADIVQHANQAPPPPTPVLNPFEAVPGDSFEDDTKLSAMVLPPPSSPFSALSPTPPPLQRQESAEKEPQERGQQQQQQQQQ